MVLHTVESILGSSNLEEFLEEVTSFAVASGLPIVQHEIDHVCFRCETIIQYRQVCDTIVNEDVGIIIIESMIGGRPISIAMFNSPIVYKEWSIPCLEITCPKPGRSHKNGFEHIEIVVDKDNQHRFTNSKAFLEHIAAQYPHIDFDRKAIDKDVNADLNVVTTGGNSIKLHARPIYEVCAYELSSGHHVPVPADYFDSL